MQPQELFEIWAPPDARWSSWAKPVLFATMRAFGVRSLELGPTAARLAAIAATMDSPGVPSPDDEEAAAAEPSWAERLSKQSAVVVDLPGEQSVCAGLALAAHGFRPVPLYNTTAGELAVVSLSAIAEALGKGAAELSRLDLPPDAPPAFLLDVQRMTGQRRPQPGDYDNRWMVFPQDFPSGNHLLSQGLQQAVLVSDSSYPADDLAHVLLRWQEAGLSVFSVNPTDARSLTQLTVTKPAFYRAMWYRAMVLLRLRRNSAGGFGAIVPQPSRGGHFG